MTTFSVSGWRKVRPSAAKGLGVADAIGDVDKALKKKPSDMSKAEAKKAEVALDALKSKLDTARSKINQDKSGKKDNKPAIDLIEKWIKECETEKTNIAGSLGYKVKVENVQEKYDEEYKKIREDVTTWHAAARDHVRNNTFPTDIDLQRMLTAARDAGKICSPTYIKAMKIPEAKAVDPKDIVFPDTMDMTIAMTNDLTKWGVAFSKEGKRNARAPVANLDDNIAIEKAIKDVMNAYTRTEAAMKQIIKDSNTLSATAKSIADRIRQEIDNGNADEKLFKGLARLIKQTANAIEAKEQDMKNEGDQWRTSSSPTGKLVAKVNGMDGYDKNTHGKLLVDRMQANQMLIRRATMPLAEAQRQIDLAKLHLNGSTSHRGYAAGL